MFWYISFATLLSVAVGRLVVYEQEVVGEEGQKGHSWTVTEESDNPSMLMQVQEFHSDGFNNADDFFSENKLFSQAFTDMAWMDRQFELLNQLTDRMSCAHHYMLNEMNPVFQDRALVPPAQDDTDAMLKYMSMNRLQPISFFTFPFLDEVEVEEEGFTPSDFEVEIVSFEQPQYDLYLPLMSYEDMLILNSYEYADDVYEIYNEEEVEDGCFMLTLFLFLACATMLIGVFASYRQLSRVMLVSQQNKTTLKAISEDKVDSKTSLLTPLAPEPARGVVVAAEHADNTNGSRFVDVVYVPLRGQ